MHLHRTRAILRGIGPVQIDDDAVALNTTSPLPDNARIRRFEAHVGGRAGYDQVERGRQPIAIEYDVSAVVSGRDSVFIENRLYTIAQRESDDVIASPVAKLAVTTSGDDHVLIARCGDIRHRRAVHTCWEFRGPKLGAGLNVVCMQALIESAAAKDQTSGGNHRPTEIGRTPVLAAGHPLEM